MSLSDDLNRLFADPPRQMTEVYQQFLGDTRATWNGNAFAIGMLGVIVTIRLRDLESGHEGIEMMAPALQPPAVRILRRRGWGPAPVPPWVFPLTQLPVIAQEPLGGIVVQSDEHEAAAIAALEPTWQVVVQTTPYALLACDGVAVTAQIAPPATIASAHAVLSAVVALARSSGLAQTLMSLDGASPTSGGDLAPSVSLAPDGLQIGVKGGTLLIARLGGLGGVDPDAASADTLSEIILAGDPVLSIVGGVATLTWPRVERDLSKIRAGVTALRGLARDASGPYR